MIGGINSNPAFRASLCRKEVCAATLSVSVSGLDQTVV